MGKTKRESKVRERSRVNNDGNLNQTPGDHSDAGAEASKETNGNGLSGYMSETDNKKDFKGLKRKRIFRARDSILTVLSRDDPNFQALYHAFLILIITGIAYSLLKDTVEAGMYEFCVPLTMVPASSIIMPYVDVAYYSNGFGPAEQQLRALIVWIPLQIAALAVYPVFKLWETLHPRLHTCIDILCVVALVLYNIAGNVVVVLSIVNFNLPPVPALVLSVEQLRFSMKSYSFVRENAYKVLYPWHKDDESGPAVWYEGQMEPKVGSFSHYLYFLFAPTMLYRDNYPMIPHVRKLRVLAHITKCCISVTFITIVAKEIFGAKFPETRKLLATTFLTCMLWGLVLLFMSGYFFLHSWNNLFGELLRFADREFYSDWWTCTSYSQFYRKWNLLIHDWIKAYIYQDLKDLFNHRVYNKIAFFPTIIISAIYHEYVLWAPMRFVVPILLTQFGVFGVILFVLRPSPKSIMWNYFLHWSVHMGVSTMIFCYAMEFYARKICPMEENIVNTFVPRFYNCYANLYNFY